MKLIIILFSIVASSQAFSYEFSDLKGTWVETVGGIRVELILSGVPETIVPLNQPVTIGAVAYAVGQKVIEVCQVTKIENNKFESRCEASGQSDHTYIQFVDKNTFVETDLTHGFGKNVAVRQ